MGLGPKLNDFQEGPVGHAQDFGVGAGMKTCQFLIYNQKINRCIMLQEKIQVKTTEHLDSGTKIRNVRDAIG